MSLFAKAYLVNAAVLVGAALVLILSPATVSHPVSTEEAAGLVLGLVALAAVNWWWSSRLLAPLSELRRAVESRESLAPGDRVSVSGSGEVVALAASYNAMLDRLERERRTAARVALDAQEAERARVAAELHDEVGQALTGVLLRLSVLAGGLPEPASSQLQEMRETVRATLDEVRAISARLRPGVLRELGLLSALEDLARAVQDSGGLDVRLDVPGALTLDEERELVCYRVVQEALTNVLRHARASRAWVSLRADGRQVRVEVRDDGRWAEGPPGTGMAGMRERAHLVGGRMEVDHHPGGGTRVVLTMPLEVDRDGRHDDAPTAPHPAGR
jgi:two-component system, NarL family, sensor histidine kinase UhpB